MTNADIALIAINKFFFYAMNYPCVPIIYKSIDGTEKKDYLPSFFKVFPPYLVEHLKGKWEYACDKCGSYGAIMKFYGELDGSNRNLMLNHIIDTYNGEQRIPLNEEMAERN